MLEMEVNSSITEWDLMDYCDNTMITILWNGKWVALKTVLEIEQWIETKLAVTKKLRMDYYPKIVIILGNNNNLKTSSDIETNSIIKEQFKGLTII